MSLTSLQDTLKANVGKEVANLIEPHTYVGLGTGSTVTYFIQALAIRIQEGLHIKGVIATSNKSAQLAASLHIPIIEIENICYIDITVDGADEVDKRLNVIKGKGGALLREKIAAAASQEVIIIVDESKLVEKLGGKELLPIEILPFARSYIIKHLQDIDMSATIRENPHTKSLYYTDQQNNILDCSFPTKSNMSLQALDEVLHATPGILETGLFLNMVDTVYTATASGITIMRTKK